MSPDALFSRFVCMSSAVGPSREGAGLRGAVVSDVSESCLSVIAAPVFGVASPGRLCWRSIEPADHACIATKVGNSAFVVSGLPSGTRTTMLGGVVVWLTRSLVPPRLRTLVCVVARAGTLPVLQGCVGATLACGMY